VSGSRRSFGNVRKLPSGRYQARFRDTSGRLRSAPATFATRKAAERHLATVMSELDRGTWRDPRRGKVTFEVLVASWRASRPNLRPTSVAGYANLLARLLMPFFCGMRADAINPEVIREWHTWAATLSKHKAKEPTGERLSPNTVAKGYRLLRAIMDLAEDDGVIVRNPCRLRGVATERLPEQRIATPEEVHRLSESIDRRYKAMVLVAAYGGLRMGELVGLRRHRIDFENGTIRVVEQVTQADGQTFVVGPPKTEAGVRTIDMPAAVMQALALHIMEQGENARNGLVFTSPDGGYIRRSNFRRRVWLPALSKAGIEHLRFHDLRHFHATMAVAAGVPVKTLMARMGHASARAALLYQHAQPNEVVAAKFDDVIAKARTANEQSATDHSGTFVARRDLRAVE